MKKKRGQRLSPLPATAVLFFILIFALLIQTGCRGGDDLSLVIRGDAVKKELRFTLDELKEMEDALVEDDYFAINSYGTEGYYHFKGIWIWQLIKEKADLKENASKVSFIAEDGYTAEYTLEEVKREDYLDEKNPARKYKMILAWEENGREYDTNLGPPFQLVVGQREPGDVNKPYWVRNVKTIRID